MTPAEYRDGGQNLTIRYQLADTVFGRIVVASTDKGVSNIQFIERDEDGLTLLQRLWPKATLVAQTDAWQLAALSVIDQQLNTSTLTLHLKRHPLSAKGLGSFIANS